MYVPSRRRCSFLVRTITAFTTLPFCTCPSGAASFTLAVITSPSPARSPVEPPSGRIICSLRAPELSATSSIVLIITAILPSPVYSSRLLTRAHGVDGRHFGNQRRLAEDFFQAPPLQLRQRPRLFQPDKVSDVRLVLFVMRVELLVGRDDATIERMRLRPRHRNHDGLVHLVRDHFADQFFAPSGRLLCRLSHYFFSVTAWPLRARSPMIVFTRAMSLRSPRIFFRLSVWPMLSWNFSLNNWSARSRSWCFSSASV